MDEHVLVGLVLELGNRIVQLLFGNPEFSTIGQQLYRPVRMAKLLEVLLGGVTGLEEKIALRL